MNKRTDNQIKSIMSGWSDMEKAHAKNTESYTPHGDKADKTEFAVSFDHRGRTVTFTRYSYNMADAVREAQTGFQWRFGFWPDEPVKVDSPDVTVVG